jgi:hypothetical protein
MSSSEQAPIVRRNFADRASLIRVLAARMTYRDAQVQLEQIAMLYDRLARHDRRRIPR